MFQTQLPSGRRRLLFLLVMVFAATVFGMRYLLVSLGWVGGQPDPSAMKTSGQEQQQESIPSPEPVNQAEMNHIKQSAESFIKRYTEHDLMKSKEWFQSLQADLHPSFASQIRLETERSRPTMLVQRTRFKQLNRSTCDSVAEKVHCYLEVTTESIDYQQEAILTDKIYEVILSSENKNWKIEGLNIHGSLD